MALLPLKQTVTIRRKTLDEWGEPTETKVFTLKCRVDEGTKLVRATTQSRDGFTAVTGEEVVSTATITFDKFADIRLTDEIYYTDESGVSRLYLPLNVERVRGLNGKAILTEVNV